MIVNVVQTKKNCYDDCRGAHGQRPIHFDPMRHLLSKLACAVQTLQFQCSPLENRWIRRFAMNSSASLLTYTWQPTKYKRVERCSYARRKKTTTNNLEKHINHEVVGGGVQEWRDRFEFSVVHKNRCGTRCTYMPDLRNLFYVYKRERARNRE